MHRAASLRAFAFSIGIAALGCDDGAKGAAGGDNGGSSGSSGTAGGATGGSGGGSGGTSAGASGTSGAAGALAAGGSAGIAGSAGGAADGGASGGAGDASSGTSGTSAVSGGAVGGTGAVAGSGGEAGEGSNAGSLRVLAFSRTIEFRHESIAAGHAALAAIAAERGFALEASEELSAISDAVLGEKDVVVFLSTSGDALDVAAEGALTRFVQAGGGFVGVHAASDTEYAFPFYGGLVGAYFKGHPAVQQATIIVEDAAHPATAHLAATWTRTDEWYGFRENPRANVRVLLRLDESSYSPGEGAMGDDHPIAWAHEYEGGRSFYTALGHTPESYSEPAFLEHLAGGISWAGRLAD